MEPCLTRVYRLKTKFRETFKYYHLTHFRTPHFPVRISECADYDGFTASWNHWVIKRCRCPIRGPGRCPDISVLTGSACFPECQPEHGFACSRNCGPWIRHNQKICFPNIIQERQTQAFFFRKMLKSGSVYVIRAETGSESGQQCSDFRPLPDKNLSEKS